MLISGADKVIDCRGIVSTILSNINDENICIEIVRFDQANKIIDIDRRTTEQSRNKVMCFHKGNGEEIKPDFSTAVSKPRRQGGATEQP